jgi:hypothetical protein
MVNVSGGVPMPDTLDSNFQIQLQQLGNVNQGNNI